MSDNKIPWAQTSDQFDEMWIADSWGATPDILTTMFAAQREHMIAYDEIAGVPTPNTDSLTLDSRMVQAAIRERAGYVVEELYEAINLLKNKPWKQTPRHTDTAKFREEIADVWHFFIELHIIAGMTAEDVFDAYFAKTKVNQARRKEGY